MEPRLFPLEKTFEIGDTETHVVRVHCSRSGRLTVRVDDKEVWSRLLFSLSRPVTLSVGELERHELELRWQRNPFVCSVWVDGQPHLASLFTEVTTVIAQMEGMTMAAPYVCAACLLLWIANGGVQEACPTFVFWVAVLAAVWFACFVSQIRRPRFWRFCIAFYVAIEGNRLIQRHSHSSIENYWLFFFALVFGTITACAPWLRRLAKRGQTMPTS